MPLDALTEVPIYLTPPDPDLLMRPWALAVVLRDLDSVHFPNTGHVLTWQPLSA